MSKTYTGTVHLVDRRIKALGDGVEITVRIPATSADQVDDITTGITVALRQVPDDAEVGRRLREVVASYVHDDVHMLAADLENTEPQLADLIREIT